jgi:hypothetical protein
VARSADEKSQGCKLLPGIAAGKSYMATLGYLATRRQWSF